jgi:hypothetical protein
MFTSRARDLNLIESELNTIRYLKSKMDQIHHRLEDVVACCSNPSGGFLLSKDDLTIVAPQSKTIEVTSQVDYIFNGNLLHSHDIHTCTISSDMIARYYDSDLILQESSVDLSPLNKSCFVLDATIFTFSDYKSIAVLLSEASISILDKGSQKVRITLSSFSLTSRLLHHLNSFIISASNDVRAISTTDLSDLWSTTLDSEIIVLLPYTESNVLVLTEDCLYILNQYSIVGQLSMDHGIPSCACVNPMNDRVVLVGTHDQKVLIYGPTLSLDWVIKTTSVPQSICIASSFGYVFLN